MNRMTRLIFLITGIVLSFVEAQSLRSEFRVNGKETRQVFESQRQVLQDSSAVIYRGYKRIIYGVIVSEDGYILTKASELTPPKSVVIPAEEAKAEAPIMIRIGENVLYKEVEIVGIDVNWDVALLKIDAHDLKPIPFADESKIEQGSWVFTNGASSRFRRRIRVGIISAHSRMIAGPVPVILDVELVEKDGKLIILGVAPNSGADEAGLQSEDEIIKINGKMITTREELKAVLSTKDSGDILSIAYLRKGVEALAKVKLTVRPTANRPRRMNKNDSMSGRFSRRRDGFARVLQVDIPLHELSLIHI